MLFRSNRLHRDGALICSVCSGALLIAETGLLNGHRATAHWAYRDMYQRNYPKIAFRNESVLCLKAEGDRIITAGGVSAWHYLAAYLIARRSAERRVGTELVRSCGSRWMPTH